MTIRPRFVLPLIGALLAGVLLAAGAWAQSYPNRPITFVVPFAPGGLSDVPARVLGAIMQARIGTSIVVENKTGASGVIGATHVWRAEPDGYTILVNALADVQNLHYIPVPYDAVSDFALIGKVTDGPPLVLIIDAKLPYKTLAELIADAKANPSKLSFGTSGPASSPVIALTQLNALAGTKIVDVPYRGSGQAAAAVVTGAIQGTFTFYSSAKPLADDGKARDAGVDHGVPQQAPQRGDQLRPVSAAHGGARHDHPDRQHAGDIRRVHARPVRAARRARQALRPFADAMKRANSE